MILKKRTPHLLLPCAALLLAASAQASLVDLGPGAFTPEATAITFSEPGRNLGDTNPVYNFAGLPNLGNVTVSFNGTFVGQTTKTVGPVVTLDNNLPSGPLALNAAGPQVFIAADGSTPTSPTLSGTPLFNGPISVLFSTPVAAVGLSGGFFNNPHSTSIEAYDVNGNSLGIISNSITGIEFYGLADSTGANVISGISFYVTGDEPAGFVIDNLTFGSKGEVVIPGVPEPGSVMLLGTGLIGLALGLRRKLAK